MKKLLSLLFPLAVLLVTLAGCSPAAGSSTTDSIVGTWVLTSYTPSGSPTLTGSSLALIMSETIVVKSDNTYTMTGTFNSVSSTDSGTWSKSGSTYTVTTANGNASSGTISGNKFTTTDAASGVYVYTKS